MTRPLDSDELGGKGEKRLAELLLDARLKPNSPDRDRVGWDSVVTWPQTRKTNELIMSINGKDKEAGGCEASHMRGAAPIDLPKHEESKRIGGPRLKCIDPC